MKQATEVSCDHCGLDPICKAIDYGKGLPEGILLRRQSVAKGETIYRSGDPFRSIFAVKSGSFMSLNNSENGSYQVLGFSFAGELIGAEGMAGGQYSNTVRALEHSSICELRLEPLHQSGQESIEVLQGLITLLGQEIASQYSLNTALVRQYGEKRLAAFIMGTSERLRNRGLPSTSFKLGMSRSDIASYLGISRETVSREITRLKRQGVCEIRGKQIELQNKEKLVSLSKYC